MCRFVMVSGASKAVKTEVFFGELGDGTLHNCSWTFMHEPPLSPPSFNQISSSGKMLYHVSRDSLHVFDL